MNSIVVKYHTKLEQNILFSLLEKNGYSKYDICDFGYLHIFPNENLYSSYDNNACRITETTFIETLRKFPLTPYKDIKRGIWYINDHDKDDIYLVYKELSKINSNCIIYDSMGLFSGYKINNFTELRVATEKEVLSFFKQDLG